MLESILWSGVNMQRVRPDGASNWYSFLSAGTPTEVEVGAGQWVAGCTDDYYIQLNTESGQGLGANPTLTPRKRQTPFEVLPGRTRYMVIEPATSAGVLGYLNRIDGVPA